MILLYSYSHWFWITFLVLCTSGTFSQKESIAMHSFSVSSDFANSSVANSKSTNRTMLAPSDNASMAESVSVIEANVSRLASQTHLNISALSLEMDNLTTIESLRDGENESLVAADRMASTYSGPLSAASITSITLGCVLFVGIVSGFSYFWYRNRSFNRPQVLSDHCSNLDSSGYIDDTSDNSEEMYSLDNDSFLNSLEAMTIQNYWTDTVKHTKL